MILKRIIKGRKLVWLDHVTKMDKTRETKKNFQSKPEGRRKVDRPRLR
jgi:hypothetical protein